MTRMKIVDMGPKVDHLNSSILKKHTGKNLIPFEHNGNCLGKVTKCPLCFSPTISGIQASFTNVLKLDGHSPVICCLYCGKF